MAIVRIDSLRTLGFAGISGTYAAIGAPTAFNWRMFRVINNTDGDMIISVDGTTDNLFVPAFSSVGRASGFDPGCREFESLNACHYL